MPDDSPRTRPLAESVAAAGAPPEVLLVCPECQADVAPGAFEAHLRRAHRIYQFRGVRRSLSDTVPALLGALLGPHCDAPTWRVLYDLALDEQGAQASAWLTAALGGAFDRLDPLRRARAAEALGPVLAESGAMHLIATLAADGEAGGRHLALAALAALPGALGPQLTQALRSLLMDRRLPADAQVRAVARALGSVGGEGPLAAELLGLLVGGLGTTRALERLQELRRLCGGLPAIEDLTGQLEANVRMSCPRCSAELRRPQMIRHLWEEHGLVLDGRRVRDPWAVIEDWVDAFRTRGDPEMLECSRTAAGRVDPEGGPARLRRLLLSRGVADAEARQAQLAEARQEHASCCPWCYALVPVPREAPAHELILRRGRLSARGYSVEVSERGLRPILDVRTPGRLIYRGPEPERGLTARGLALLLSGPLVLAALGCAAVAARPLVGVLALLTGALVGHLLALRLSRWGGKQRLLDYAWAYLAPRLHQKGYVLEDSAFLAGLARLGGGGAPAELLRDLVRLTEQAVLSGEGPPLHLTALRRRLIEEAAAAGEDPVPLVALQLARCFEGRLSLTFAQDLLEEWVTDWWTHGNLARLRVLLCDRAFEAGFEVRNLLDAGQTAPALGAVLGSDTPQALAALRLLWSLRPSRPWDRCGDARTAFELAADPESAALLGRHPDLLLWQQEPAWEVVADGGTGRMGPAQVFATVGGVWLQDVWFTAPPRVVEVRLESVGCGLLLGERLFRGPVDLEPLARRMERWFRYFFHEFQSQVDKVQTWQSPDRSTILRSWGAVPCPECRRYLLARVGEVGLALDEAAPAGRRRLEAEWWVSEGGGR